MVTNTPMITLTTLQLCRTFLSASKDTGITRRLTRAMSSLWLTAFNVGGVMKMGQQLILPAEKTTSDDIAKMLL